MGNLEPHVYKASVLLVAVSLPGHHVGIFILIKYRAGVLAALLAGVTEHMTEVT